MTKVFFTNYSIVGRLGPGSWNNEICKHVALSSKAHTSRTEIPGRLISLAMAAADDRAQLSINTTVQCITEGNGHSVLCDECLNEPAVRLYPYCYWSLLHCCRIYYVYRGLLKYAIHSKFSSVKHAVALISVCHIRMCSFVCHVFCLK